MWIAPLVLVPVLALLLPPDVPLPAGVVVNEATLSTVDYDEVALTDPKVKTAPRGRHLRTYLSFEHGQLSAKSLWSGWKPLLQKAGWRVTAEDATSATLQRDGGRYVVVRLGDYQDPLLDVLLGPSTPKKLVLPAPAATPERVGPTEDFPYLPRFVGATFTDTGVLDVPFVVEGDKEQRIVASRSVIKRYTPPKSLSKLETALAYADALKAAGWEVLPRPPAEGITVGHYGKNGRDVWAMVGRAADDSDQGLTIVVADVGGEDWASLLDRECKLQLLGVNFDFDKATLRPESTSVLERVASLLRARPTLRFEVSGHTDNVGDAAYNQKLSGARAQTVVAWLTQRGIKASQLTAKGYGLTQPIADNDTDVGRARNRRVQLACMR